MELYKEILVGILAKREVQVVFPELESDMFDVFETECYKAMEKIKTVIEDDSFDDRECFWKIEKIVQIFEALGSNGGGRHDF